jgi:hypothetical protein
MSNSTIWTLFLLIIGGFGYTYYIIYLSFTDLWNKLEEIRKKLEHKS